MSDERRVLVVDDHRSFAEALAVAIDAQDGLRCVAIAATAKDGLDAALRTDPDIALVDMRLPDMPGPSLVTELRDRHPSLPVLVLTAYADAASVSAAAGAGVCGFLRKECSIYDIVETLRTAGDGPMVIDADTLGSMMRRPAPRQTAAAASPGVDLTPRELEVLDLLAEALDAQGIATRLGLSVHTVRGYVKSLLAKFDAHSQLEVVVRAMRLGVTGHVAGAELDSAVATSPGAGGRPSPSSA